MILVHELFESFTLLITGLLSEREKEGIVISVGGRGDSFGLLKVGSSRPLASAIR